MFSTVFILHSNQINKDSEIARMPLQILYLFFVNSEWNLYDF